MKTLDEKLNYNKSQNTDFSFGYRMGVDIYKNYPKETEMGKLETKRLIDNFRETAVAGDKISKGFITSVSERKTNPFLYQLYPRQGCCFPAGVLKIYQAR